MAEPGEPAARPVRSSYRLVADDAGALVGVIDVHVLPRRRVQGRGHIVLGVRDPELAPHRPVLLPRVEAIAAALPRHRPLGWPFLNITPAPSAAPRSFDEPPPW